jgi:hypothetical protein
MRRIMSLGVVLAVQGSWLAATVLAQPPSQGVGGGSTGRAFARPSTPYPSSAPARPADDFDLLSPYGSRAGGPAGNGSAPKPYTRTPVTRRPPGPPLDRSSRGAVFSRGVGSYYPSMRSGQAPNRNVVDHRSLCVPGRRALLQR